MKDFHVNVSACTDVGRHKKRVFKYVCRMTATAFSIMCAILVCGIGTVRALEYIHNVIRGEKWGFESADTVGMARTYVLDERMETVKKEADPVKHYDSLEEFKENEDIIFPQPSLNIGEAADIYIAVSREWALVRYELKDRTLWLERTDYAGSSGHHSMKTYPEAVCNERTYTTAQGYTYTLIDSARSFPDTESLKIHAAAAVGTCETCVDFEGYSQEEAEKILDGIDLSLYE